MSEGRPRSALRPRPLLLALLAAALIGLAGAWLGWWTPGAAVAQECRAAKPVAESISPLAKGEVAALSVPEAPALPPEVAFKGPSGEDLTLASFKGKTVLVNLWATWCVPCRQEMPALDKVQAELGGPAFEVVAINVDTRNPEKPKAWLQENGIRNLTYYAEPGGKLLQVLQRSGHVVGLPTTVLIDATGCEIGLLKGPAEWASPDATELLRTALKR
jgi:thiol-disulfide isomerase/thioredoxin